MTNIKHFVLLSLLFLVGVGSIASGWYVNQYIDQQIQIEIEGMLKFPTPDQNEDYDDWLTNTDPDDVAQYMTYYLFNLTNSLEYISGEKAIYEEHGPYAFRQYKTKFDVSFNADETEVTYSEYSYYVYDTEKSVGSLSDKIININPSYVGVIDGVGSEKNLLVAFAGPTVGNILDGLKSDFASNVVLQSTPSIISGVHRDLTATMGDAFYSLWANSTGSDIDLNADGSGDVTIGISNITLTQTKELFNSNNPNSFVLTSGFYSWLNPDKSLELANDFRLTADQVQLIVSWLSKFYVTVTPDLLLAQLGLEEVSDLGYMQWGSSALTQGISLKDLDDDLNHYPEFWAYANFIANSSQVFSASDVKSLFSGSYALNDATNVGTFLYLLTTEDFTTIDALWGLSTLEAGLLGGYFQYVMSTFITDLLQGIFAVGGGLITSKSVTEWLFKNTDPLLALLAPENADSSFFANITSVDDTRIVAPHTFNTGKSDVFKAGHYVKNEGNATITVWAEAEEVRGSNGQTFGPGVTQDDVLVAWSDDVLRTFEFVFEKKVILFDVDLLRFKLKDSMMGSASKYPEMKKYYQDIDGLFNLTSSAGIPLFLSKPHFLDAADYLGEDVLGMHPDASKHGIFIDIEPRTGAVFDAAKRLQFNLLTDSTDLFYTGIQSAIMPLMWIEQSGQITEDLANQFREGMQTAKNIKELANIGGTALGITFLSVFVALIIKKRIKK